MPEETLTFPPLYCLVGAYRLVHDGALWRPMWRKCSSAAKQAGLVGLAWALVTWPFQRLFVRYFMSASASVTGFSALYSNLVHTADITDDNLPFIIPLPSLQTFATMMFVVGQVHAMMEFWLARKLRECRNTAYVQTVRSRGKPADWWTDYHEEFSNPPTKKAIKDAKKQAWYAKLATPLVRFIILKVFLLPMDFVPFFGMALTAALRSLSYGRQLHATLFEAKRMSPMQIELWITERQSAYRAFGFTAALLERIPLLGMVFSISNRIGAAMWAHDLEKRQQRIRSSSSPPDEFKQKPTLKKLYKQLQHPPSAEDEAVAGNFNGEGMAVVRCVRGRAVFTHLSFTFPLKLIAPHTSARIATQQVVASSAKSVAPLYMVGYGGGLVSGDTVHLDLDVGSHVCMVLLTQGSTKVFKTRTTHPTNHISTTTTTNTTTASTGSSGSGCSGGVGGGEVGTRQVVRYLVRARGTLVVLPDPVTCFGAARYDQVQRFDLRSRTSSLILLDWLTPGRTAVGGPREGVVESALDAFPQAALSGRAMKDYTTPSRTPERWCFDAYRSRNELRIATTVVARDVLLLSQSASERDDDWTELARRNAPYDTYASLFLAGPDAQPILTMLSREFQAIQIRPATKHPDVIWSLSIVDTPANDEEEGGVGVVRIAGQSAEAVREWLRPRLAPVTDVIGAHLFKQAL